MAKCYVKAVLPTAVASVAFHQRAEKALLAVGCDPASVKHFGPTKAEGGWEVRSIGDNKDPGLIRAVEL